MSTKSNNKFSKRFWIIVIFISLILILAIACGFAIVSNKKDEVIIENKKGGNLVLNYSGDVDGLSINNVSPSSDLVAMKNNNDGSYFDFSVDVDLTNANSVEYEISVVKVSSKSTISDDDIKIYLEKEDDGTYSEVFSPSKFVELKNKSKLGSKKDSMVIYSTKCKKSGTYNFRLRMWLSDTSLVQSGSYSVEVDINGIAK